MPQVLLVDDHPLYHEGLASAFARLAPDLSIVRAESAEAGLDRLRTGAPIELALIDLILPNTDGLRALAQYAAEFPHIPRLLISGKDDPVRTHHVLVGSLTRKRPRGAHGGAGTTPSGGAPGGSAQGGGAGGNVRGYYPTNPAEFLGAPRGGARLWRPLRL